MGLFDKVKNFSKEAAKRADQRPFQAPQASGPSPLRLEDSIKRYRKQRGINLGSWFTTEDWLATELYSHAADPKKSDFDLARAPDAKTLMEHHWDTWIVDADWQWIKDRGFNSVRLPVSFE